MDERGKEKLWMSYSKNRTPELREQIIIEYAPLVKLGRYGESYRNRSTQNAY